MIAEMVLRERTSPDVLISAIKGMEGDAERKVETYLAVIENKNSSDALREILALEAFLHVTNITDPDMQVSKIQTLINYLSEIERARKIPVFWNSVFRINSYRERSALFEKLLPTLTDTQNIALINDVLKANVSSLRKIYILEQIQDILGEKLLHDQNLLQMCVFKTTCSFPNS